MIELHGESASAKLLLRQREIDKRLSSQRYVGIGTQAQCDQCDRRNRLRIGIVHLRRVLRHAGDRKREVRYVGSW